MYYDLQKLADDRTVLPNPHKGWYYHYIDNGLHSPFYRDRLPKEGFSAFPGMHHLYLRFDWIDVEAREGEIDFSPIEEIIAQYKPLGLRFALRLCTYEASFEAVPAWVWEKGAKSVLCPPQGERQVHEPVYDDPIFLSCLERLMQAYARQFDGREEIELVDIGSFGTWGEGHTYFGSGRTYPAAALLAHTALHVRYFKKTRLFINDDMLKEAEKTSSEALCKLIDYCHAAGVGLRDDSVAVDTYAKRGGYDTLDRPELFDRFAPYLPTDIECQHCRETSPEYTGDGFRILEAMRRTHATYCGFHGYVDEWLPRMQAFTEYAANRLGYWYFINGIECPELLSGCTAHILLHMENRGFAPTYRPYALRMALIDADGVAHPLSLSSAPDLMTLTGESRAVYPLRVSVPTLTPGEYRLALGLFEGERPLYLGIAPAHRRSDGFYTLISLHVAAP